MAAMLEGNWISSSPFLYNMMGNVKASLAKDSTTDPNDLKCGRKAQHAVL